MSVKELFSNKTVGSYLNLFGAVLSLVIIIAYSVTTNATNSFNKMVLLYLVVGFAASAIYFLVANKVADIANLVSVVFITLALGQYAINSINTFADVLNGITMFGSTGGIEPIITILVMMALVVLAEMVSCFMKRVKE